MNVTISDIASASGVSASTVARVINNNGYVSEEKRALVLQTIQKLGYVPNRLASSLRNNRRYFIGHILPVYVENPFFSRLCTEINSKAGQNGYHVLTTVTTLNHAEERAMLDALLGLMVDAIIFSGETASTDKDIEWVLSQGIPVVMVERPRRPNQVDAVLFDSYQGASLAVNHLVSKGHSKIGIISKSFSTSSVESRRYFGFTNTMEEHGFQVPQPWQQAVEDYTYENGKRAMEKMLHESSELPTALFVTSDVLACGVLQALYEAGIRVPEDISIIGFDNTLSASCSPKLSSIEMQLEEAANLAVEMAINRSKKKYPGSKAVTLSPVLVERDSVRTIC